MKDMDALLAEFAGSYLVSPAGRDHLASYAKSRATGLANLATIRERRSRGEDVTDQILDGLLPHSNTPHNRKRGAWTFIAPAITKDIRTWFERKGWARPEDWPQVAAAILTVVETASAHPDRIDEASREFAASPFSKGIQSAFLSPILSAVDPREFLVLNSKSRNALRFVTGERTRSAFAEYPATNARLKAWHGHLEPALSKLTSGDALTQDVLDQFCHWLVAIKKVAPKSRQSKGSVSRVRPGVLDRVDPAYTATVIDYVDTNQEERASCFRWLAEGIRVAHEANPDNWSLTLYRSKIHLNVGRILVFQWKRGRVGLALLEDQSDEWLRQAMEPANSKGRFRTKEPVGWFSYSPADFVRNAPALILGFQGAIRAGVSTARTANYARSHSPGVIDYLEQELGTELPRPSHESSTSARPTDMIPAIPIDTPRTVFKKVDYELSGLLHYIQNGDVGLPEIQRPFVWSATKVRDLFDSMYRGFPVGSLLFWENLANGGTRTIGTDSKQTVPRLLVVDGQQRLTSLYAVLGNHRILDRDFRETKIEIAFRPRDAQFEVTDAAIRHDPEFIPDISVLWSTGKSSYTLVSEFLRKLEGRKNLTDADRDAIGRNLDRLFDLQKYPFTTLEISSTVGEEAVADIFVRINSEGVTLRQSDFLLTLLSVFWEDGRRQLEDFARRSRIAPGKGGDSSPYNHLIQPEASQLLRAAIAYGFRRAILRSVYQVLRGKDLTTGEYSEKRRTEQFDRLKAAQSDTLNLSHWHQFLGVLQFAGFRTSNQITSESAVIYSYALYLIGKKDFGMDDRALQRIIARWFFMSILTRRYTAGPESTMEADLARLRGLATAEEFQATLERTLSTTFTEDYWTIQLPNALESSASRSPGWMAYVASQNVLGARVLFSEKRMSETMDPSVRPTRKPLETHHLFPKAWLERNGFPEPMQINQIANRAHIEWPENTRIGATPPKDYIPRLRKDFSEAAWGRMCLDHALPQGWENLDYQEFLAARRDLMAALIRRGMERLSGTVDDADIGIQRLDGTPLERSVWESIEALELRLREIVWSRFSDQWCDGAEKQVQKILGDLSWDTLIRNRGKYEKQYGSRPRSDLGVLDFCYLGQLGQLITSGPGWSLFKEALGQKPEIERRIREIVPVRNDFAHFRQVPERELLRCRIAVEDLMELLDGSE